MTSILTGYTPDAGEVRPRIEIIRADLVALRSLADLWLSGTPCDPEDCCQLLDIFKRLTPYLEHEGGLSDEA